MSAAMTLVESTELSRILVTDAGQGTLDHRETDGAVGDYLVTKWYRHFGNDHLLAAMQRRVRSRRPSVLYQNRIIGRCTPMNMM